MGNAPDGTPAAPGQQTPVTLPTGPQPVRLVIPRIYVDAPVVTLSVEPGTDVLAVPNRGDQAAWYDFNPPPGLGYNAIFSGHVDWQTQDRQPIAGVFYRLRELQIGDEIDVTLQDGNTIAYRVTGNVATAYNDPNLGKALQPTPKDEITLVTCGGTWIANPAEQNGGNYTHRVIVRAERVVSNGAG
ncbi:MAG TPA: class F sortase [Dehalococcoidia bacterium]|nr:class F sortase [Dehalococcoidia bacterium]